MDNRELTRRMGTAPVLPLLLKMSGPMIFSMLVSALYNIVDSIFVSLVSKEALDAVTLVFPLQTLVLAFALGVGVGTNAIVSKRLGERNVESASRLAQTGMFLAIVVSIFFAVFGVGIAYAYVIPFTSNGAENILEVRRYAIQYISIVMCLSAGLIIEILCEKAVQSTGNMKVPMISQIIGAVTNICLDALFILVFKWGVIGAAVATVAGQILAMVYMVLYIATHHIGIDVFFKHFKVKWHNIRLILNVGIPTLVVNAVTAVTITSLNGILMGLYTSINPSRANDPITVLGIYFKLQSFVFMPVFGITQGAFPILGYNFGAQDKKRFVSTFKWATILSLIIMIIGTIIFQTCSEGLIRMFDHTGELVPLGSIALREISWCFIGAAFGIIITSMFQSLGKGVCALLMSLLRQIIILIPAVWLFGKFINFDACWWGYPFAEAVTLIIFFPIALHFLNKAFKGGININEQELANSTIENKNMELDGNDISNNNDVNDVNNDTNTNE